MGRVSRSLAGAGVGVAAVADGGVGAERRGR